MPGETRREDQELLLRFNTRLIEQRYLRGVDSVLSLKLKNKEKSLENPREHRIMYKKTSVRSTANISSETMEDRGSSKTSSKC